MVNKTNLKNRDTLIKEVINDLEKLLNSFNLDQKLLYAIKENINFFKAIRNYITYVLWLLFKAPFLKKELILEIFELGITKWENKLHRDLLENEKKFKWMLSPLVNYIKNCIIEGRSQIIGDLGCGSMELELQIIKNLIEINFKGEILFIGFDNSINALISAKNNLKEIENYIDFYFEENIDENRISNIFYQKRNQFVIVLTKENIFNLSNKFKDKFFDVIFHSKFKHHLSGFQREELDRILIKITKRIVEYDSYRDWYILLTRPWFMWNEPILLNGAIFSRLRGYNKKELLKETKTFKNCQIYFYPPDYYLKVINNE